MLSRLAEEAEISINFNLLSWASLCLLALAAPGMAAADVVPRHGSAAAACRAAGDGEPGEIVTAVNDGRGGSLVWLTDADTNLWLCSADARGSVYVYGLIFEDLLRGAGAALLPPVSVDRGGKPVLPPDPLGIAQGACRAYLDDTASAVLSSGPDGLEGGWIPGYFVFLETEAGDTFLCNATPNAQVWAFARTARGWAPPRRWGRRFISAP